jgi:hypothetical protein
VSRVHQQRRICPWMLSVLPVVPIEAGRNDERDVGRAKMALPAHERSGHVPRRGVVKSPQQSQCVLANAVMVNAGRDVGHSADDRIGLDGVKRSGRRAGPFDHHDVHRPLGVTMAAEYIAKDRVELIDRHAARVVEGARSSTRDEGAVESPRSFNRRQDNRARRRHVGEVAWAGPVRENMTAGGLREPLGVFGQDDVAPLRHVVVKRRLVVPRGAGEGFVAIAMGARDRRWGVTNDQPGFDKAFQHRIVYPVRVGPSIRGECTERVQLDACQVITLSGEDAERDDPGTREAPG